MRLNSKKEIKSLKIKIKTLILIIKIPLKILKNFGEIKFFIIIKKIINFVIIKKKCRKDY